MSIGDNSHNKSHLFDNKIKTNYKYYSYNKIWYNFKIYNYNTFNILFILII